MTTRKYTLTASLIALLAAGPAFAQQSQTGQSSGTTQQQTAAESETAQDQQSTDREMPEAATPQGHGTSDIANVETPQGEVGADGRTQQRDQGRMVMLDVESFSETIYERGFRQGYIRGIADARERFAYEMERIRARREDPLSQQERMESARSTTTQPSTTGEQGQGESTQTAGGETTGSGGAQQSPGGDRQVTEGAGTDERGTIIVLPPGVTPEMFVEQLMEANEAAMRGR